MILWLIFFIPILFIQFYYWGKLISIKKHDFILYQFCQLRREIIKYLFDNRLKISNKDYEITRKLLEILNDTIHHYNIFKLVSNLNNLKILMKNTKENTEQVEMLPETNNQNIHIFQKQFSFIILKAFFTFTPFLKHRFILNLIILLVNTLISIGLIKLKKELDYTQWFKDRLENQKNSPYATN